MSWFNIGNTVIFTCCFIGGWCYFIYNVVPSVCKCVKKQFVTFINWID